MTPTEKQLCKKCKLLSLEKQKEMKKSVRLHSHVFSIEHSPLTIGAHAIEKAEQFSLDLKNQEENIRNGKMIEVQRGRDSNEYKYIYRWEDEKMNANKEEKDKTYYHAIILHTPDNTRLINVYDPSFDMSFKWNEQYDQRVYFNEMRKCCVLREDHIKNIHKGFQSKNQPTFYQRFQEEKETIMKRFRELDQKTTTISKTSDALYKQKQNDKVSHLQQPTKHKSRQQSGMQL